MDICKHPGCGSAALNDHPESGLCDKCYWREEAKKLRARVEKYLENDYVLIAAAASNLGFDLVADKRLSGAVWSEFTDKLDALKAERDELRARVEELEGKCRLTDDNKTLCKCPVCGYRAVCALKCYLQEQNQRNY